MFIVYIVVDSKAASAEEKRPGSPFDLLTGIYKLIKVILYFSLGRMIISISCRNMQIPKL